MMISLLMEFSGSAALYFLVICAPMALAPFEPYLIFIFAAIGLIPLTKLIGELTTHYGRNAHR
jgi:hypothetical protein